MNNELLKCYPNQDPKVLFLYEVIGSYFTDIIFNHIYLNASLKISEHSTSLMDEYVKRLHLYIIGIKNDMKCYESTIKELHKYYSMTINNIIDFNSFINLIINSCIPPNFISQLSITYKNEIVCNIVCHLITNLIIYVTKPEILSKITINHKQNEPEIIRALQDFSIQTLITKKISIINKFLKESGEISEVSDSHLDIINELKLVIKRLMTEKNELVDLNNSLKAEITSLNIRELKMKKLIYLLQNKQMEIDNNKHKKKVHIEDNNIFTNVQDIEPDYENSILMENNTATSSNALENTTATSSNAAENTTAENVAAENIAAVAENITVESNAATAADSDESDTNYESDSSSNTAIVPKKETIVFKKVTLSDDSD